MADPGLNVTIAELSCMTVDRLKATLKGINDRCNTRLKMNGLKADLVSFVLYLFEHTMVDMKLNMKLTCPSTHILVTTRQRRTTERLSSSTSTIPFN